MNIASIFASFGTWGLGGIIILETGFLPAFFLPGDTLLFSAGYFIDHGEILIHHTILILGIASVLGNILGYLMGVFAKEKIERYVERNKEQFEKGFIKTKSFFNKYGAVALIIARFFPLVRTIAPFLAGVTKMNKGKFLIYSIFSGFMWVTIGLFLGKIFGQTLPDVDHLVSIIMMIAVIGALVPVFLPLLRKVFKKKLK